MLNIELKFFPLKNQLMPAAHQSFTCLRTMLKIAITMLGFNLPKTKFEVDPSEQYISGMVSFHFTTLITTLNEVTIDVDQNLAIDSITSKQGKLNYTRPDTISAIVEFAKALTINEKDSFIIYFHGAPTTRRVWLIHHKFARRYSHFINTF